jgi:hypothetical protein
MRRRRAKRIREGQARERKKEGKPARVLRELPRKDKEVLRELLRKNKEVCRELSHICRPP